MRLEFNKPWPKIRAVFDKAKKHRWLLSVANYSQESFRKGLYGGPHTGRVYRRRGKVHQASAAGEWPANETGALVSSMRKRISKDSATIGTNMPYSIYLRGGTPRGQMARRKMSDNALNEGALAARPLAKGISRWRQ